MSIQAVILAAGTSSRFPGDKLLVQLDSRKVIEHVLDLAQKAVSRGLVTSVVVASRPSCREVIEIAEKTGCRVALAPDDVIALSLSLEAGLSALDPASSGALVLLGDEPKVPLAALEAVIAKANGQPDALVRARYAGSDQPGHPVYIGKKYFPLMASARMDRGFAEVARLHELQWEEVRIEGESPDIDTADDLERWQS